MTFRVVIPTAGLGSRLNNHTKYLNKSLVTIANKPIISHIIDQFPVGCEFVIALGYKGALVKDYLQLAHPNTNFFYVDVDPYEGKGSGLGFSLLCCEHYLQEPFVFISCDTLVEEPIKNPDHNWMGYAQVNDSSQFRTIKLLKEKVVGLYEKTIDESDATAYIGLAGIYDYSNFWNKMHEGGGDAISQGESYGLSNLIKENVKGYEYKWHDTGTDKHLEGARKYFKTSGEPNILEKENEAIWFVGNNVIKYSDDKLFIKNRVKRALSLSEYVPEIINFRENMYTYKKINASVLSDIVSIPIFKKLLTHSQTFWKNAELEEGEKLKFNEDCMRFYRDKTMNRINLFYKNFDKIDNNYIINDEPTSLLGDILNEVDWGWLSSGIPVRFHGDYHFENILFDQESGFTFLDWRQDFCGYLYFGDIYYDFAKLMHGLIINHEIIATNNFNVMWEKEVIKFDFHRKNLLVECEEIFTIWLKSNGYEVKKVNLLTALIFLNIAPLHHWPYSLLLYSLGKQRLLKALS